MDNKLDGGSLNVEQMEMEKLRAVFPQCFVEGKLDIDKLLSLCGEYIDNDFEKYKFEWKGKGESLRLAQRRSMGTLRPAPEESVDWDTTQNLYIEGDNLEVLKLLQTAYYRKVKMIYIDPPYNTGNDLVYEDDFKDPISRYKEVTAQTTKSNPETMGRYHTNWLNMMYPRLRLAYNLLSDDGYIFISIDDNEVVNLRKLCDEVFGEENFVNLISINMNSLSGVKMTHAITGKRYPAQKEYLLLYKKGLQSRPLFIEKLHKDKWDKEYNIIIPELTPDQFSTFNNMTDEKVNAVLKSMHLESLADFAKKNDIDLTEEWKWNNSYRIFGTKSNTALAKRIYDKSYDQQIVCYTNNDGNKRFFRSDYNKEVRDPRIELVQAEANSSVFLSDNWIDISNDGGVAQEGGVIFPNGKKPLSLIQRILKASNNKDGIILDFFSGSATTAHAVMQQNLEDGGNRNFIMVQLPELPDSDSEAFKEGYKTIAEIGKQRIRISGAKIKAEWVSNLAKKSQDLFAEQAEVPIPPDTGFKVFKLDTSNLKTWDATPVDQDDAEQLELLLDRMNDMVDTIKPDRTDLDVVYEIMPKIGIQLTYPVEQIQVKGKTAYSIGENCEVFMCLQKGLTTEMIESIVEEYLPAKMVLSEKCFADDTAMANAHYILKDRQIELKLV